MDLTTIFHRPAQIFEIVVMWTIVSSAISALPAPHENSSPVYQWFYTFSNVLLGSLKQAFMKRTMGGETMKANSEVVATSLPIEGKN
jgi:hypothetical protein